MTTVQMPQTIRATIHQDALSRVPSFFNASIHDALNELFQNARRSGATRIDVTLDEKTLTVSDDGRGISDPTTLLSFGQTGWTDTHTRDEHPAGMGLYALARRERVTIRSKSQTTPQWQVSLTPEHFTGKMPAPLEILMDTQAPSGTTVTITLTPPTKDTPPVMDTLKEAAKYHPLPVYCSGEPLPQEDFLRNADHIEHWEGVRIGVYNAPHSADIMNFYGIVVRHTKLPAIDGISTHWQTQGDVYDCPHLELTLPARGQVVETSFMDALRTASRRAIYRAISAHPTPVDMPKFAQIEAAAIGITIPDAAPKLRTWGPELARDDVYEERPKPKSVSSKHLVMDVKLPPADQQALARAANAAGISNSIFERNPDLEGYHWYDRLPKISRLDINVRQDGNDHDLQALRKHNRPAPANQKNHLNQRPDAITLTLVTTDARGTTGSISMNADIVFESEQDSYNLRPIVAKDSEVTPTELSSIMMDSFFEPRDDAKYDSFETQENEKEDQCDNIALELLSSKEEAELTALKTAFNRHVAYLVPEGMNAVFKTEDGKPLHITLSDAPQDPHDDPHGPEAPDHRAS